MRQSSYTTELPASYWAIIIVSCGVLFGLVALFLTLSTPKVPMSVQVYGPTSLAYQTPAGFRVGGFNDSTNSPIDVTVAEAALTGPDGVLLHPAPCPGDSADPAVLCFPALPWSSGVATLTTSLRGPSGDVQALVAALPVNAQGPPLTAQPGDLIKSGSGPVSLEILSPYGPPVTGEKVPLWLRLVDNGSNTPLAGAAVSWRAVQRAERLEGADAPAGLPLRADGSGLLRLFMPLTGLGDVLALQIQLDPETEVTWQQDIPADGMVQLAGRAGMSAGLPGDSADSDLAPDILVRSATATQRLFCTLFLRGVPIAFYTITTKDYEASIHLGLPIPELHWLACGSRPVTSEKWAAAMPLVSSTLPSTADLLAAVQTVEPKFSAPALERLSKAEAINLRDYLLARLEPPALPMVQLANSYQAETDLAVSKVKTKRFWLLVAMGLVGLGLVSWAFSVVYRQSQLNQQALDAVTREDGEEDDQPRPSRRRLLWSLLGIIVPMILNIVGLIFLMTLLVR